MFVAFIQCTKAQCMVSYTFLKHFWKRHMYSEKGRKCTCLLMPLPLVTFLFAPVINYIIAVINQHFLTSLSFSVSYELWQILSCCWCLSCPKDFSMVENWLGQTTGTRDSFHSCLRWKGGVARVPDRRCLDAVQKKEEQQKQWHHLGHQGLPNFLVKLLLMDIMNIHMCKINY